MLQRVAYALKISMKNKRKHVPDWDNSGLVIGGQQKAIGKPVVYYYPGPRKRPVACRISSYTGYCPGAVHYFAVVEEADNSIWSWRENCWTRPWDSGKALTGFRAEDKFITQADALCWCRCVVREQFSPATHIVDFHDATDSGPIPIFFWRERETKPEPFRKNPESLTAYFHKQ